MKAVPLPRSASRPHSQRHRRSIRHPASDTTISLQTNSQYVRDYERHHSPFYAEAVSPHGRSIQSIWQRSPMIRLASTLPFTNRSALSGHQRHGQSILPHHNASTPFSQRHYEAPPTIRQASTLPTIRQATTYPNRFGMKIAIPQIYTQQNCV